MRGRLIVSVLLTSFAMSWAYARPVGAQVPPTHGELIPGGAEATAGYNEFNQGTGTAPVAPRGSNSNRSCWYEARLAGENYTRVGLSELQQRLGEQQAAGGGDQLQVRLVCEDADTAANRTVVPTTWPRNGSTAFVIPPAVLAEQARDLLWFPPPAGATTPSLGEGSVAQLDTYLLVGNWAPVSATAQAGPIWSRVTATPVTQHWVIEDNYRSGERYEVDCAGAGVAFDPTTGLAPPSGVCVWPKPPHSSAGQPTHSDLAGSAHGQPCFPATVTIQWAVSWETNAGVPGGNLEPGGESAASTCIVVKEVQAVVSGDGPG